MMARSTKKASSRSTTRKASTARKPAVKPKAKKTMFQKLLTAEGWKRLMMGKMRKKSR